MQNEIKAAKEERASGLEEVEKFKRSYAKYVISDMERIRDSVEHPYVATKKDVRRHRRMMFFNKLKRVLGI